MGGVPGPSGKGVALKRGEGEMLMKLNGHDGLRGKICGAMFAQSRCEGKAGEGKGGED